MGSREPFTGNLLALAVLTRVAILAEFGLLIASEVLLFADSGGSTDQPFRVAIGMTILSLLVGLGAIGLANVYRSIVQSKVAKATWLAAILAFPIAFVVYLVLLAILT